MGLIPMINEQDETFTLDLTRNQKVMNHFGEGASNEERVFRVELSCGPKPETPVLSAKVDITLSNFIRQPPTSTLLGFIHK